MRKIIGLVMDEDLHAKIKGEAAFRKMNLQDLVEKLINLGWKEYSNGSNKPGK